MNVLGWTVGTSCVENVRFLPVALGMHVAISASETASEKRRIFVVQCRLAEISESFLPATVGFAMSEAQVLEWTDARKVELADRLQDLHGHVQISLRAKLRAREPVQTGSWLRQRARARAEKNELLRYAQEKFTRLAAQVPSNRHSLRMVHEGCFLDVLAQRGSVDTVKFFLKSLISKEYLSSDKFSECAIVGPLPAYSFSGLGETE